MNLTHVNDGSLTNIHFYDDNLNFADDLQFKNIIFAGNGVYNVLKNDFCIVYDKLDIEYNNTNLNHIDGNIIFKLNLPKPSIKYFIQIVEMFKYIYGEIKSELTVNLYYNKSSRKFQIEIMDQKVSPGESTYNYGPLEMNSNYVRYLQIHSHHSMAANFSGTDKKDEENSIMSYFGVIGKLNQNSDVFDVDKKFRIWTGLRFIEVGFMEVFDVTTPNIIIDNKHISVLDRIIQETKDRIDKESQEKFLSTISKDLENFDFKNFEKNYIESGLEK